MNKNNKIKPKISILGFLKLRQKLITEIEFPVSKNFLKRYKKLNNNSYELNKLKDKVCEPSKLNKKNEE